MGFYLIGRGRSAGEVRLISDVLYDDRQSALDELARMSALPDFAHRDAEVFVVDLASAVPVLLVPPPAEAVVSAKASADVAPEEPAADEMASDEVVSEEVVSDEVVPEEADSEEAVEIESPAAELGETAGVWEAPVVEPVDEAFADAVLDQAEAEPAALADALKRAAGAMESEGISAPESVGPAAAAAWPWEAAEQDTEEESGEEAEEPAAQKEYVPSPFEEPAIDAEGGLLTNSDSEEDTVMPRPVIMGDYADDEPPPAPPVEEFGDPGSVEIVTEEPDADVPPPPVEEIAATVEVVEASEIESDADMSGILADLETSVEPQGVSDVQGSSVDESTSSSEEKPSAELTCDDCVYVTTCPHKDDLEPSSCGNFQWKSV